MASYERTRPVHKMRTSEYAGWIIGGEITVSRGSVLNSGVTKDPYPKMCIHTFYHGNPKAHRASRRFVYITLRFPWADPMPATARGVNYTADQLCRSG